MSSHTVTVLTQDKFALPIQIHSPKQTPKGVIIYYHGGGLIAGTPHDLPSEVIALFTEHFYLAEAPYRLAPEVKIDTIMSDALCVFDAVFAKYPDLPCFTFGRSSGGFLALQAAHQRNVQGVLDFYGFAQVALPELIQPHAAFRQMTAHLNEAMIQFMIQPEPIIEGHAQFRYPLYLYTRGQGQWFDYTGITDETRHTLNLDNASLKQLPPVFIAHAKRDIDVPYHESLRLMQHAAHAELVAVDSDAHDFDRTFSTEAEAVYLKAVKFLHQWADAYSLN
ncbi:alpha/beta hydrolase [Staphylococcus sp. IVB6181]|uniref:alpha/beta hydrolase n=1 Tax=Staphylococcus sp. IVB6181 TaxID=2929481 RepID=UPI0021D264CC|nr:alpha/beta hydrolase [Staphylococcus sp. IVB6181]UXV35421.1 alpha/beta hydrolase [Staphylococcus sp. IVB6181]